ncbi:MAG: PIN domain-containing protein [Bryobacteraceae bacterium]
MIQFRSFQQRLADELDKIEADIVDLWRKGSIEEFRNHPYSGIVVFTHPYHWKSLPAEHRGLQAKLLGTYKHWFELFNHCHQQHSSDVRDEIKETDSYVISAIELQTSWATEATVDGNAAYLAKRLTVFRQLLAHPAPGTPELVLVPDTNALLQSPDPAHYADVVVGTKSFKFALAPTALSELDQIKQLRGHQPVGEKAEKAIRLIKGWRNQGSVLEGVTVAKTITVQMIPTEPRMSKLPSWLDADNKDDRLIGTALEIQCSHLLAVVVLVTGDINLQNKAEMAFLPWAEPPQPQAKAAKAAPDKS